MAKILSIRQAGRRGDRCEIELDDGGALKFRMEVVMRLGLKPGQEVEARSLEQAVALEETVRAKEYALNMLSRAGRSRRQVADRLRAKGFAPEVIEATLERLGNVGLIDDAQFARSYTYGRVAERSTGRRALQQELAMKGVDRETATKAVEDALQGKSERDLALEAARSRWPRLAALPKEEAQRKLLGFLARRGFAPGVCWAAVKEVAQKRGGAGDADWADTTEGDAGWPDDPADGPPDEEGS